MDKTKKVKMLVTYTHALCILLLYSLKVGL